ncbi:MAG: hypothetical protein Q9223_007176 [Gallowayella weberi]
MATIDYMIASYGPFAASATGGPEIRARSKFAQTLANEREVQEDRRRSIVASVVPPADADTQDKNM